MNKNVTRLPVLGLVFYPITTYQGHFFVLVGKLSMFFHEKHRTELKWHHSDVSNVDVLTYSTYETYTESDCL